MFSFSERQQLAKDFSADVARMLGCLEASDKRVTQDEVVYAWADYSDASCASWLMLPEQNEILLKILLEHLPKSPLTFEVTIQDAGDGSGDQILEFPSELFEQFSWKEGDTLRIAKSDTEELVLRRVD